VRPNEVRWVRKTTYQDTPNLDDTIALFSHWELNATFDVKPLVILAVMPDGTVCRLDSEPA